MSDRTSSLAVRPGVLDRAALAAASRLADDPAWMRERRETAWAAAARLPHPAEVWLEEWRRTDTSALDLAGIALATAPAGTPPDPSAVVAADERAGLLVCTGGRAVAVLDAALAARGVVFTDLAGAAAAHPDLVRDYFLSTLPEFDGHRYRALHAALWTGGVVVYVPAGVEVALPLVAQSWLGQPDAAVFPHTLLVAAPGSRVTLVDLYTSADGPGRQVATAVAELIVQQGAQVRYIAVRDWGAPMWEVGSLVRARVARDATVHSLMVALGGGLLKVDVESHLHGPGASVEMLGLFFAAGAQHMDFHTLQEHGAPHTTSDLLYKGAVRDTAKTVFAGLIRVHQGAQKTNAFQSNRNLILSAGARADSIPKLEIMANDLRCTHGSATSRLHDEHIFYLMSRGLTRAQAVRMIVEGFFADVFDRIPLERPRAYLQARIGEKMA
ncbi:MAG: Fe-S cluster assembly protein SufD [Armatimonadota bacterium]|nr:Fe-S cluster assembly protein SufD [Armatimonadota bacterium]MDR7533435.1 Fe-S cluster assembly protein SufD [Armatimonadota bacterium]MDR7536249.1 Fe-S cluster assembly protein SufD [Armatimonadota bacterium]